MNEPLSASRVKRNSTYNSSKLEGREEEMDSNNYRGGTTVARPSFGGRWFGSREEYYLSGEDERILLQHNITVIDHLGEGFYGHVWKGRYITSGT